VQEGGGTKQPPWTQWEIENSKIIMGIEPRPSSSHHSLYYQKYSDYNFFQQLGYKAKAVLLRGMKTLGERGGIASTFY
jgi:hypothetical protein